MILLVMFTALISPTNCIGSPPPQEYPQHAERKPSNVFSFLMVADIIASQPGHAWNNPARVETRNGITLSSYVCDELVNFELLRVLS